MKDITSSGQNKSNNGTNHSREVFSSHSSRLYQHQLKSSDLPATLARLLLSPFPFPFCPASLCLQPCSNLLSHFPSTHPGRDVFIAVSFAAPVLKKPLPSGHGWKSSSNHIHFKVHLKFLQQHLSWNLHLPRGWLHLGWQELFKYQAISSLSPLLTVILWSLSSLPLPSRTAFVRFNSKSAFLMQI